MERWVNKVAIVTGVTTGIGAAIAEMMVKEGVLVAGFARKKERVQELFEKLQHEKGKLYVLMVDITNENEILTGFKWIKSNLGPVHILINNAGVARHTSLIDGDTQKWKEVFETNVFGLCIATREAVRDMRTHQTSGHIIHMNSIAGHTIPYFPGTSVNVYAAAKFAVTALTETLRRELMNCNLKIKVTSISPGVVASESSVSCSNLDTDSSIPQLKPQDVADAIKYVLTTPQHVQVHELILKPVGEQF
ncbi:farnesol dehydrogenase-like isoform X2 [Agrilus planipennis]|uniref:Farnesol dehydrogenase-like isoform X2 n=1 Tax=Agrilus planipennis TaxID=224129 RepID=A0A7F5R9S1_AGRPL|nr:farnesol dehydrogenase-like isoform X2 [Agrilus planipennis]